MAAERGAYYVARTVREIPFNWRRASHAPLKTLRMDEISQYGTAPRKVNAVFLPGETLVDPIEVRDWLNENDISPKEFDMYGRVSYMADRHYDQMLTYMGLNFQFAQTLHYVHFKLRWHMALFAVA